MHNGRTLSLNFYFEKKNELIYAINIYIIIIIITLFQEDNILGTNASQTYGPQIQSHTCV